MGDCYPSCNQHDVCDKLPISFPAVSEQGKDARRARSYTGQRQGTKTRARPPESRIQSKYENVTAGSSPEVVGNPVLL